MRALAVVLIVALALAGCSHRPRANPFDPGNPDTGGRPAGFFALAGEAHVTLRWNASGSPSLVGWRIERAVGDTGVYRPLIDLLPSGITTYSDFGLADGVVHRYRLSYVFASGPGAATSEDFATPGPLIPWVGDALGGVFALTADGRHVAQRVTLGGGVAGVGLDRDNGVVWACNFDFGEVDIVAPGSGVVTRVPAQEPVAVAVQPGVHDAWVADDVAGAVYHLSEDGSPAVPPALSPLEAPFDVALSPDGRLWVCEHNGNRVRLFASDGTPIAAAATSAPSRVAVDSVTHEAWVSSFDANHVVHLAADATPLDTLANIDGPIGVTVDPRRRKLWVAEAAGGAVRLYDLDGTLLQRVTGLFGPRTIAVDLSTGNAWVSEREGGAVTVVSPAGTRLLHTVGIGAPDGIVLDDVRTRAGPAARATLTSGSRVAR
ncbi:MAG TPA: hypothetical protein VFK69_14895 [Candidatus Eisenbacteria bacterium]|nr:hypothetical protein [Candidatus Eisenbacteria bacterium]